MRMSEKKRSELYNAVRENIMVLRIEIPNMNMLTDEKIDDKLRKLEIDIWKDIKKTLNLQDKLLRIPKK